MRSLETAAQAGVLIVAALATTIVVDTVRSGFPAISSGELPLWGLKVEPLPSAQWSYKMMEYGVCAHGPCTGVWRPGALFHMLIDPSLLGDSAEQVAKFP